MRAQLQRRAFHRGRNVSPRRDAAAWHRGVLPGFEIPVTIQGDTIVYNTDSFVSGTEKKLADVIKKLPGLEINDEGEIEAEGKKVGKIMVNGKDFFDGDTKLATKNIPANAISKVEAGCLH